MYNSRKSRRKPPDLRVQVLMKETRLKMLRKEKHRFETALYFGPRGFRRIYRRQNVMVMNQLDLVTIANLKNALYTCIVDALSESNDTRRIAEEKISAMEIIEDFAVHLCEFAQNKSMNFAVRQMSSVLLKQYVDGHWSNTEENHVLHNFVLRNRIRKLLLQGLKEPNSKIRNAFAYCIAYIGSLDYPEKWPSFFEDLQNLVSTRLPDCVYGILRVYEDIIRDCDPHKTNEIAEHLLKQLCFILHDAEDVEILTATVHVLCIFVNVCGSGHNPIRLALCTKLIPLCEYFIELLQGTEVSINDYGLKTNIIRFFTLLVQKNGKSFAPILLMIMPVVWTMVMQKGDNYAQSIINNKLTLMDEEDEEGKVVGFTPLVLALFDFIHSLVDNSKLNSMLFNVLTELFYYMIIFMHITKNMEEAWLAEPSLFVEDDSSENFDTSIRVTVRDVLIMICNDFDSTIVIPHLAQAINRHTSKLHFTIDEWKIHESIMFSMGSIKDIIIRASLAENLQFPLFQLATMWQFSLNHPNISLFFGRTIWFSGKFSPLLSQNLFNNYMKSTLSHLKDNDVILCMFAIRTIIAQSEDFESNCNKNLIANHLPTIVECLLENLSVSLNSYLFILNLATLKIILSLGRAFAELMEPRVTPLIINILMKYHADPDIVTEVHQIVKEYCLHTEASSAVREKFTPILGNILNSSDDKVPCGLQTVAMDLLQTLVKCSKSPLSDDLILIGFPAAVKSIIQSDDQLLMSIGGECLRSYLLIGAEQICNYTDPEGTTGLEYVLRAITHLIDPAHPEEACKRIGRLIITLINKVGSILGSHMHFLLRAILSKMQRVDMIDVWQSLLVVFVYLFYTELEFVVNFLTSVPGPTGAPALEFILREWLHREPFFVGSYDRTVNVVALTKLLEYSVTSEDSRLNSIMVRADYVPKDLSSREGSMPTKIPILGKAFKIVCLETICQMEKNTNQQDSNNSEDSDDSDYETESQMSDYRYYVNDPDQQDVLYAQDPVFRINILAHLTDFMQKFKTIPRFEWYLSFLTLKEKNMLASLGIF